MRFWPVASLAVVTAVAIQLFPYRLWLPQAHWLVVTLASVHALARGNLGFRVMVGSSFPWLPLHPWPAATLASVEVMARMDNGFRLIRGPLLLWLPLRPWPVRAMASVRCLAEPPGGSAVEPVLHCVAPGWPRDCHPRGYPGGCQGVVTRVGGRLFRGGGKFTASPASPASAASAGSWRRACGPARESGPDRHPFPGSCPARSR